MRNPVKSWIGSVAGASFRALLHTVLMTSLLRWSAAQLSVSPDVVTAAVGETVTLSVGYRGRLQYFIWYRGGKANANESILNVFGSGPPTPGPRYTGRETALPDGSLRIRDVQVNYTGSYTVQMNTDLGGLQDPTVQLRVYVPVTKPTVTSDNSHPVEYNNTVTMTCKTSEAAEKILWFFKNQDLLIDNTRIGLSANNQTLRISNVSRLDSGTYQCKAINTVSDNISDPQTLTVSYGPEDTKIDPSEANTLQAGETLTLSCNTRSVPEIDTYEWFHNNISLQFNKTLSVLAVSSKDEGNYTCAAHNNATSKSANASVFIAVKDRGPPDNPGNTTSLSPLPIPAIVGIVIASLLAVILVVVLVYYCRTKSSKVQSTTEAISRGTTHVNNGAQTNTNSRGSAEEMYYTTVHFEPKTQKARAPPPLENTVYSQVKAANHHGLPPTPPSPETIIYSEARLTCEGKSVRPPPTENTIYSQVKPTHHK
ncbi:carcinoembryonic antigen-related cell adhesion molecule 6-like isoform X2 [Pleurodeles waltl]|uniref:carcinoembryonic antigen-related cell adhesion molecule 6-like isoform X2 n=1 Tax=Pleurodeles waltl TaxID=8319 RepID=UPI003709AC1D